MRRIRKGAEPACLQDLRDTPGTSWSSAHGDEKQAMRDAAFVEQGGLCAYCMSSLDGRSNSDVKMEHYIARGTAQGKDLLFQWSNLLGVCLGVVGIAADDRSPSPDERFHCDTYRGSADLYVHPAVFPPDAGGLFSYTIAGEIRPATNLSPTRAAEVQKTIDNLNLNIDRLKRNRAGCLEAQRAALRARPKRARVRELLQDAQRPDPNGRLMPYCQVAVAYLERKLRQMS